MTDELVLHAPADPFERLGSELDRGRRGFASYLPVAPEAALAVLGLICVSLGVALIIIGWSGVAHSRYLQQELAYVVSGGILGLAFVVVGVAFYVGYLLMRQARSLERLALAAERSANGPPVPAAAVQTPDAEDQP